MSIPKTKTVVPKTSYHLDEMPIGELPLLVTGGAGFIGSNFVQQCTSSGCGKVVVLDKLTYAGNPMNLAAPIASGRCRLIQGDIADESLVSSLLREHRIGGIVHFAAESHVDRSIHGPEAFIQTNIVGTFRLLQAARAYQDSLKETWRQSFRFLHVSTDEVYGSLEPFEAPFTERSLYEPNSPYAASKAASDHLVRAFHHTYGLSVLTTNCSNNYGPMQFPEKLIPLCIHNALAGKPLPIYGDGQQVRDWLYVGDHCEAIRTVLQRGLPGCVYNIGGWNERPNLEVVRMLCAELDRQSPRADGAPYSSQITFVKDRPGHDRRYAIDARRIEQELGWRPRETFETGLAKTISWYLSNAEWVSKVTSGEYRRWVEMQYES